MNKLDELSLIRQVCRGKKLKPDLQSDRKFDKKLLKQTPNYRYLIDMRKAVGVIAVLLILFVFLGALVIDLYSSKDNVAVSGKAGVSGAVVLAPTLQTLEFTDTQTGSTTTISHFTFAPQTENVGNYSVTLKDGHTYNVYVSYFVFNQDNHKTQFITTFTVNAPAGQKEITKDFVYPNPP